MSYEIKTTDEFERDFKKLNKKYRSLQSDIAPLLQNLIEAPQRQGILLQNDCYKVRIPIKSKSSGKSGGARVIHCIVSITNLVYLLQIYDKSDKGTILMNKINNQLKRLPSKHQSPDWKL